MACRPGGLLGRAIAAMVAVPIAGAAQDVRIGYGGAVTTADPHFHALTSNLAVHQHVYEGLVRLDERLGLQPELAIAWRLADPTTWEFDLRPTARWHDGAPFTAEDVVHSADRVATVPNSPGRFAAAIRGITGFEVLGPHRLRIRTELPNMLLPQQLTDLLIVPRATAGASTADFGTGRSAIGTGPYRFRGWSPGSRYELARNEAHDGAPEPWRTVTFELIANDAARLAALLTGAVHLIDQVPPDKLPELSRDPAFTVVAAPGVRNIFLFLDQMRDAPAGISDLAGRPMGNPLRDGRVRLALSQAINREGIVHGVMGGLATASGQLVPAGMAGHDPELLPPDFDPDRARRLLAEAGFPDGFSITLSGPSDRYVNDDRVLQAIAQGWTRAGLRVRVEAQPSTVYFPRLGRGEIGVGMLGWGTASGEADGPLATLIATTEARRGWGSANRSGYSNPGVDARLAEALATPDRAARAALYQAATRIAMQDVAIIPLHFQTNAWASRRGFVYTPRVDERTLATGLRPSSSAR